MQRLFLTLLFIMAGLLTQPLFAETMAHDANIVQAEDSGGDDGTPPTEEEEEPDCE